MFSITAERSKGLSPGLGSMLPQKSLQPCITAFSAACRAMMPGASEVPEESYSTPRAYKPAGDARERGQYVTMLLCSSNLSLWASGPRSFRKDIKEYMESPVLKL